MTEKIADIIPISGNFRSSPTYATKVLLTRADEIATRAESLHFPAGSRHSELISLIRDVQSELSTTLQNISELENTAYFQQLPTSTKRAKTGSMLGTCFVALQSAWSELDTLLHGKTPEPEGENWNRITVVANRLPVKLRYNSDGKLEVLASPGGLNTTVDRLMHRGIGGRWVGWAGTSNLKDVEQAISKTLNVGYDMSAVPLSKDLEQGFYEGYSTQVLYPLFLNQVDDVKIKSATHDWEAYKQAQKLYADKVCEDIRSGDIIWAQEYNLLGVGLELRKRNVKQPLGIFIHTPFPTAKNLSVLQKDQQKYLVDSMLAYDLVGMQTKSLRQNLFDCVRATYPDIQIRNTDDAVATISFEGRVVRVGSFPISIDAEHFVEELNAQATQKNISRLERALSNLNGAQLIFNVGRLDPNKGFYEELLAFDKMLEKHVNLRGKVVLYQLVVPSREHIDTYREYKEKIVALARKINAKYRSSIVIEDAEDNEELDSYPGMPVRQIHGAMKSARFKAHIHAAGVVNIPTKSDGMNLVAKEAGLGGNAQTVVILGKDAGAVEELGNYTLVIDPTDIDAHSEALFQACTMATSERESRKSEMAAQVQGNTLIDWWERGLAPAFQEVWREKTSASTRERRHDS